MLTVYTYLAAILGKNKVTMYSAQTRTATLTKYACFLYRMNHNVTSIKYKVIKPNDYNCTVPTISALSSTELWYAKTSHLMWSTLQQKPSLLQLIIGESAYQEQGNTLALIFHKSSHLLSKTGRR
jgi:hypothetical protein